MFSSGRLPPASPPDLPGAPRADGPAVDEVDGSRAWERAWRQLDRADREALHVVLTGMALRRSVSETDVGAIVHWLNSTWVGVLPEPLGGGRRAARLRGVR